jgi:hypothetical protein
LFSLPLTCPPHPISQTCLGIIWMGLIIKTKNGIRLGDQLYICWFITELSKQFVFDKTWYCHFLQVIWSCTRSSNGITYFLWRRGSIWLLDATVWWWLYMISSTMVDGDLLIDCIVYTWYMMFDFVSTLCDPWYNNLDDKILQNKWLCASIDAEAEVSPPFQEKTHIWSSRFNYNLVNGVS